MSEWEEFCEGMGCNAGSEEDYEYMLDMLDEPVLSKFPAAEIAPSVGRDALIAVLIDGVIKGGLEVSIRAQKLDSFGGEYKIDGFDDWPYSPLPNLFLRIAYEIDVPITSLIDAMRTSGVPLLSDEGIWLAWDAREKCVKLTPLTVESLWHHDPGARPEEATDNHELRLRGLLRRAALSTDHGKKPLLIQSEFLDEAMQCREIEFEDFRRISGDAIGGYVLAFYDSTGKPASIPLSQAMALGLPICTRNAAYKKLGNDLVPLLSYAKLLVGAFQIATRINPNEFEWFTARERGTVFHSAIERIDGPKNPHACAPVRGHLYWKDPQKQTYVTSHSDEALTIANKITEWASDIGTVYITSSGHPLDADLVTTPELYQHAIKTLNDFGYSLDYSLTGGVHLRKVDCSLDKIDF